jgi:hypothetical protein
VFGSRLWAYHSASSSAVAKRSKLALRFADIRVVPDKQFQRLTYSFVPCRGQPSISILNSGCVLEIKIRLDFR